MYRARLLYNFADGRLHRFPRRGYCIRNFGLQQWVRADPNCFASSSVSCKSTTDASSLAGRVTARKTSEESVEKVSERNSSRTCCWRKDLQTRAVNIFRRYRCRGRKDVTGGPAGGCDACESVAAMKTSNGTYRGSTTCGSARESGLVALKSVPSMASRSQDSHARERLLRERTSKDQYQ